MHEILEIVEAIVLASCRVRYRVERISGGALGFATEPALRAFQQTAR